MSGDQWRWQAACGPRPGGFIGASDEVMFPNGVAGNYRGKTPDIYAAARVLCRRCPVASACLAAAYEEEAAVGGARHGIRGGLSPDEREQAAGKLRPQVERIPCGSPAAYRRHLRRSEVPCPPCRRAEAVRNGELKSARVS